MTFMQSLGSNPGGSGIYNSGGGQRQDDPLQIVNLLKDREMTDFQNKANFMSDLSIKQDRIRRLYDQPQGGQGQESQQGQMNTVMGADPSQMTGFQKGELGIRQNEQGIEKQKIAQAGKLGEERIGIQSAQEKLNQQKSDQINAQKTQDMQRKIEESNQKIQLAQQALENKTSNAEAQLEAHKTLAAAVEERHKLELQQKEHQFGITSSQHEQQIKSLEQKVKDARNKKVTTEINPEGNKRTTTTRSGDAAETVKVTGKDGKTYEIPSDKKEEWDAQHAP